jgi:asparagine synthase (glutamine-hydrolysing)
MLRVQDSKQKNIAQWQDVNSDITVIFTVHNSELVHQYEDAQSITVFYGFLDQDFTENNPAQHLAVRLNTDGMQALNECYGSFIVIHFQKNSNKFILANDALGDFALHYFDEGSILNVSDLPAALLTKTNCEINHERLLHYFALNPPRHNGCFYQQIKQVNPGFGLVVEKRNITNVCYYTPPKKINYKVKSVNKLSSQFKELMQQVIAFQSQGETKIGVMMSGGMDSTFVAANGLLAGKEIQSFSYTFPNMPEANESIWIEAMRPLGLKMSTFSGEAYWPLKSPWYISLNSPISNPYRNLKSVVYQQVEHRNIKILLTGVFADHLYTGYIYWLVDQVKRKPFRAIKSLLTTRKQHGLRTSLRQISPKKWSKKQRLNAAWLNKKAHQSLNTKFLKFAKTKHPHPQQYNLAYGISTAQSAWLDNEFAFMHGFSIRHPFRDRRIVEFIMSIPAWVLGNNDDQKSFVRKTSVGLLPASIIRRRKTTTLKPLFIKGVLEKEILKVKKLLNSENCSWQSFVASTLVHRLLNNPTHQHKDNDYMVLWQCISYELWKRRLKSL